jgi:small subunit ribosomal protein S7
MTTSLPQQQTLIMPPRLNLHGASRSLAIRTRPSCPSQRPLFVTVVARRGYADGKDSKPPATGPNQDVLGHVSEEAADMGEITGETKPDLSQGTPVQEARFLLESCSLFMAHQHHKLRVNC